MLEKIDHIGIAVNNLEQAIPLYRDRLGLEYLGTEEVPWRKIKVAFFRIGESKIELLESMDPESAVAKHLAKRGEGVHHLAYQVKDLEKQLERLKQGGVELIDEQPRPGAAGALIAFLHPRSTGGILVELCQHG